MSSKTRAVTETRWERDSQRHDFRRALIHTRGEASLWRVGGVPRRVLMSVWATMLGVFAADEELLTGRYNCRYRKDSPWRIRSYRRFSLRLLWHDRLIAA